MLSNKKVKLLFALVLIVVEVVKSDDKNFSLEVNKDVKRFIKDILDAKSEEQLMSGRFGKSLPDEEDIDNEVENEYDNEYDDETESQGIINGRYGRQLLRGRFGRQNDNKAASKESQWLGGRFGKEVATQWFNGRFGREIGGRFLPRFGREFNKPHYRGRFGRVAKL